MFNKFALEGGVASARRRPGTNDHLWGAVHGKGFIGRTLLLGPSSEGDRGGVPTLHLSTGMGCPGFICPCAPVLLAVAEDAAKPAAADAEGSICWLKGRAVMAPKSLSTWQMRSWRAARTVDASSSIPVHRTKASARVCKARACLSAKSVNCCSSTESRPGSDVESRTCVSSASAKLACNSALLPGGPFRAVPWNHVRGIPSDEHDLARRLTGHAHS